MILDFEIGNYKSPMFATFKDLGVVKPFKTPLWNQYPVIEAVLPKRAVALPKVSCKIAKPAILANRLKHLSIKPLAKFVDMTIYMT